MVQGKQRTGTDLLLLGRDSRLLWFYIGRDWRCAIRRRKGKMNLYNCSLRHIGMSRPAVYVMVVLFYPCVVDLCSGGGTGRGLGEWLTLWHKEQKISIDAGSSPATLPKVDSAFHSPDGVGK